MTSVYPSTPADRTRWIVERRPARNALDPWRPYAYFAEAEMGPGRRVLDVATVFLTNRECPWRCLMCDLWKNTLAETVPEGAIAAQVRYALERLPAARPGGAAIKLYNAGSFFDPKAIPTAEDARLAELVRPFERTIVECHPAFVGRRCFEFRGRLRGKLEVAMGLETVHPGVLGRLNKRMTLDQFRAAADALAREGVDLRVFILVRPPWLSEAEGLGWARRSLDFAFECGATACSLIPTRAGNGAMDALEAAGEFRPPSLAALEAALEYGLSLHAGRVFADLWDVANVRACPACSTLRARRVEAMNRSQRIADPVACTRCRGGLPEDPLP